MSKGEIIALSLLIATLIAAVILWYRRKHLETDPKVEHPLDRIISGDINLSITATNTKDAAQRTWLLFEQDPTGKYEGDGKWGNVTPIASGNFLSSSTWQVTVQVAKDYWFVVEQNDGQGSYSGTASTAGVEPKNFSGVNANNAAAIQLPRWEHVS